MFDLRGEVALITGAAGGIGSAAAKLFCEAGAAVAVGDLNQAAGEALVADLGRLGHQACFVPLDVTAPESVISAVGAVKQVFGRISVLYNNAGGSTKEDKAVTESSEDAFWKTIKVDLFGTWLCSKYAIPEIIENGGGVVINSSSLVAAAGWVGKDAYTASKGAIAALTRSWAVEYASKRVRVNAVAPGLTLTLRLAERVAAGNYPERFQTRHLLGFLQPEQIASAALFLASSASSGMTGHIMAVDAGYTAA